MRKSVMATALLLLASGGVVLANPFAPPLPEVPKLPMQPMPGEQQMQNRQIQNNTQYIGQIDGANVYYHEPTQCYLYLEKDSFLRDSCFNAVSEWVREHPLGIGNDKSNGTKVVKVRN